MPVQQLNWIQDSEAVAQEQAARAKAQLQELTEGLAGLLVKNDEMRAKGYEWDVMPNWTVEGIKKLLGVD